MEILLLGIYSFFVWLIVFKLKWVPWNFLTQVIVITIPIVFLTALVTRVEANTGLHIDGHPFLAKPINIQELIKAIEGAVPAPAKGFG